MTKEERALVKPHIDAMVGSGENCTLCGGEKDRVITAMVVTTSTPPWRRVLISPLCKACAEDPELKTRLLEKILWTSV